ncbi:hypothetical protein N7478_007530 [Penicillium angulare]|uniref:uncharacterized protein n=1 Tax=Penicillium angulare TaxID=116970 RepID=UPI0025419FE7|nr:uncharacterized protein N7478_007530 [Penicillium angulare]KAJ5272405.1 hypothetical protein N7478_007530 [Penicillium angulare]
METYNYPDPYIPSRHSIQFPFNLASRIWQRMWHGILFPCQKPSPSPSSSVPSSPTFARFPLTPTPESGIQETSGSSPIFQPLAYDHISSLLNADYFRGTINQDGISQNGEWDALRVLNPDLSSQNTISESSHDIPKPLRIGRPKSLAPVLPDLPFIRNVEPSLSVSFELGLRNLRSSVTYNEFQQSTYNRFTPNLCSETIQQELAVSRSLNERPRPAPLSRIFPRNGLTRALELFCQPQLLISPEPDPEDESEDEKYTDPSIDTPSYLGSQSCDPSLSSSIESAFDLNRFRGQRVKSHGDWVKRKGRWVKKIQWSQATTHLEQNSPQGEVTTPESQPQSQFQSATPSQSSQGITTESGSQWSRSRRSSDNCSGSTGTSPGLSFIRDIINRRDPGIFVSLNSMESIQSTLAAGTAAQQRRIIRKQD